ncbi:MAG: RyR domain-containing protein [Aeromonas veronii]
MQPLHIATVAHAVNAAYCAVLGDRSQSPWELAPEWQQQSALAGVTMHLANPDATPEQSHESWLAEKIAAGWTYGPVKDAELKQHPCCVPYAELPIEQRVKDHLFKAVVNSIAALPDVAAPLLDELNELRNRYATLQNQLQQTQPLALTTHGVSVQYIGHREQYVDRLYGSGLLFTKGQVRTIPGDLARRFLAHPDTFLRFVGEATNDDDTAEILAANEKADLEHERKELDLADLHREIDNFADFTSLAKYAKERYGLELTKQHGMAKSLERVHAHIDQFGGV